MAPVSSTSRRKAKDDDAAYIGASGAKRNRDSVDKTSADGRRAKRKKVQQQSAPTHTSGTRLPGARNQEVVESSTMVDFTTLSRETLHRYLVHYDLVPVVFPSPMTASDPPPPLSLLDPPRFPSPPSTLTPANRPRRDSITREGPRRSSRLVDDENGLEFGRTAILADISDIDAILAKIAQRHFRSEVVREVDTLASFMCTLKTNGEYLKPSLSGRGGS